MRRARERLGNGDQLPPQPGTRSVWLTDRSRQFGGWLAYRQSRPIDVPGWIVARSHFGACRRHVRVSC